VLVSNFLALDHADLLAKTTREKLRAVLLRHLMAHPIHIEIDKEPGETLSKVLDLVQLTAGIEDEKRQTVYDVLLAVLTKMSPRQGERVFNPWINFGAYIEAV
jgi:hypothetical protein